MYHMSIRYMHQKGRISLLGGDKGFGYKYCFNYYFMRNFCLNFYFNIMMQTFCEKEPFACVNYGKHKRDS